MMFKLHSQSIEFKLFFVLIAVIYTWPIATKVPHDIVAQMIDLTYKPHKITRQLSEWNALVLEDQYCVYGAVYYGKINESKRGKRDTIEALRGTPARFGS